MNLTNRMIKTKLQNFVKTKEVEYYDVGLCGNFNLANIPNIEELFQSWECFSGNDTFPVKATCDENTSCSDEYYFGELYRGEQLKYRLSLAKHILNNLN